MHYSWLAGIFGLPLDFASLKLWLLQLSAMLSLQWSVAVSFSYYIQNWQMQSIALFWHWWKVHSYWPAKNLIFSLYCMCTALCWYQVLILVLQPGCLAPMLQWSYQCHTCKIASWKSGGPVLTVTLAFLLIIFSHDDIHIKVEGLRQEISFSTLKYSVCKIIEVHTKY